MKKVALFACIAWIIVYFMVYTIAYFSLGVERFDALANFGKQTYGTVAAKLPEQHQSVIYYYVVDNIQYTGRGGAGYGNPDFDSLQIGDKVLIVYQEDDPLNSYPGQPQQRGASGRSLAIIISVIVSMVLVGQGLVVFLVGQQIGKSRNA